MQEEGLVESFIGFPPRWEYYARGRVVQPFLGSHFKENTNVEEGLVDLSRALPQH
jgi:hypothetical protein